MEFRQSLNSIQKFLDCVQASIFEHASNLIISGHVLLEHNNDIKMANPTFHQQHQFISLILSHWLLQVQ